MKTGKMLEPYYLDEILSDLKGSLKEKKRGIIYPGLRWDEISSEFSERIILSCKIFVSPEVYFFLRLENVYFFLDALFDGECSVYEFEELKKELFKKLLLAKIFRAGLN